MQSRFIAAPTARREPELRERNVRRRSASTLRRLAFDSDLISISRSTGCNVGRVLSAECRPACLAQLLFALLKLKRVLGSQNVVAHCRLGFFRLMGPNRAINLLMQLQRFAEVMSPVNGLPAALIHYRGHHFD